MVKPEQAAAMIGVTAGTLKTWRWLGKGPNYMKIGTDRQSRVRYDVEDVLAWIERAGRTALDG